MSFSYWQDSSIKKIINCDVLIIGAGLAGLSAAYWVSRKEPTLRIVIIDKSFVGSGASGRNAGFITCGSTEHFSRMSSAYGENKAFEIWKFTEDNHKLLMEELGPRVLQTSCDYRQLGSWTLAATEHEGVVIKETVSKLRGLNISVDWLDKDYVDKHLQCEGFFGGAKYSDDGEINPIKLLQRIRQKISQVEIIENSEVDVIEEWRDKLYVKSRKHSIYTDSVVLATNAWAPQLFDYFKDKISPVRGQILVTEPVDHFLEPCYCNFVLDYFRQLTDGSVLIGGFRNADVEKEVGYSDETNEIINQKLKEFLIRHFPTFRSGVNVSHCWSGVMGFAVDGYPFVGSLPEEPRVFFSVGFTAHGLGFTFKLGKVLAELMLEGKDPGIFSARRF